MKNKTKLPKRAIKTKGISKKVFIITGCLMSCLLAVLIIYQYNLKSMLRLMVPIGLIGMVSCNNLIKEKRKIKDIFLRAEGSKSVILITLDRQGNITYCNKYALKKLAYTKDELLQMNLFDIVLIEEQIKMYKIIESEKSQKNIDSVDIKFKTKNFRKIYALCTIKFGSTLGGMDGIEISGVDLAEYDFNEIDQKKLNSLYEELAITEEEVQRKYEELLENQEELKKSEERYSLVMDTASMGIWDLDISSNKMFCSDKCKEILEIFQEGETKDWREYLHVEDKATVLQAIYQNTTGKTLRYEVECRVYVKEAYYKWVYIVGKVVRDNQGQPIRMMGSMLDINDKKEADEKIQKMAFFDNLTGLHNKNYLVQEFEKLTRKYNEFVMLFMDTNNFKTVNECFGHYYGDLLLVEVANRLKSSLEEDMILTRISGDEFAVLICGKKDRDYILKIVSRIEKRFDEPFEINNISFVVSFSIGVAIYPDNGKSFGELLAGADTAMYKAKEKGRRSYVFFDNYFKESIIEKVWIENNLRTAIKDDEFLLYYQPQLDISTKKIKGFEALIRWKNKKGEIISPFKFIGVAEETGLIIPIGEWVIREACHFIKKLYEKGREELYVAVNVSVIQLAQEGFVEMIQTIIEETQVNPSSLHIEITETILMESIESNIHKMEQIKEMGVLISLDDFGKGYSSLNYLKQLPISILKIEKAFIDDITEGENKNITRAIINLGHDLGLKVVAEGVETEQQLSYLKNYACDMIQGYLISKPLPEAEAINLILEVF